MCREVRNCTPEQRRALGESIQYATLLLFALAHSADDPAGLVKTAQKPGRLLDDFLAKRRAANTPGQLATPVNPTEPSR